MVTISPTVAQDAFVKGKIPRATAPAYPVAPYLVQQIFAGDVLTSGPSFTPAIPAGYPFPSNAVTAVVGGVTQSVPYTTTNGDIGAAVTIAQTASSVYGTASTQSSSVTVQVLPLYKPLLGSNMGPGTDPGHGWIFKNAHFDSRGAGADGNFNGTSRGLGTVTVSATSGSVAILFSNNGTSPAVNQVINLDNGKFITITNVYTTSSARGTISGGTLSATTFSKWTLGAALDPTTGWPLNASTWVITVPASILSATIPGQLAAGVYHGIVVGLGGVPAVPSVTGTGSALVIDSTVGDTVNYTITLTGAASCFLRYSTGISYADLPRDGSVPTTTPPASIYAPDALAYYAAAPAQRLMDLLETNAAAGYSQTDWASRPTYYAGATSNITKPYAPETAIGIVNAVANYAGSLMNRIYWPFPAKADASYGAGLATLWNSLLDAKITKRDLDVSNETWNPTFAALSTYIQLGAIEAQASLSAYAAAVTQVLFVTSDGAGTATVNLAAPCAAFYSASGQFITNGATATFVNTGDTSFNATSVTITTGGALAANQFTYPISGSVPARYMGFTGGLVGTFATSTLPVPSIILSLSTADTSGTTTVTTAFDVAYMTAAGLSLSGTSYVAVNANFVPTLGGADQTWVQANASPSSVFTVAAPAKVTAVSANTFTYTSGKLVPASLSAATLTSSQLGIVFNLTSNLVNDGLSDFNLFDIGSKYYVRQIYNVRSGWITARPKASYPGDQFGFGIQLGKMGVIGGYTSRTVHWNYAAFLGGGIGAQPTAATNWLSNAYGGDYALCGTQAGLTSNSGAPWTTLADLMTAVNSYITTYCTLMVRSFVYTCQTYGLTPVAYEGSLDVTFAPNLAVEYSTDNSGLVNSALQRNYNNWFQQGGEMFYDYSGTPGGYVNIPFVSFTGSVSGNQLTVSSMNAGSAAIVPASNLGLSGTSVPSSTRILSQASGTTGGVGVYNLNNSIGTIASETMFAYVSTQSNNSSWPRTDYYANTAPSKRTAYDGYSTGYSFTGGSACPGTLNTTNYVGLPVVGTAGANSYYWSTNSAKRGFQYLMPVNRTRRFLVTPWGTDSTATTVVSIYIDDVLVGTSHYPANGTGNSGALPLPCADPFIITIPSGARRCDAYIAAGNGTLPGFGKIVFTEA